ncbi:MAG: helix-turn-helix transcriptional regulator [Chamaesiphon sp. CSU_1_12]|nr:helix-turn-helix transcriptional regulator [Chamaesiphon sp. CSU_1_12]
MPKKIGVDGSSLSRWENGEYDLKLRVSQISKLIKLYNITFTELEEAWENTQKKIQTNQRTRKKLVHEY